MSRGFPEEFKQELLSRTDIVDVVSRHVDLKKKGGKYWGCCPFHNEKTASFNVDVNRQFFYCFGCEKGGDAITFVMETEHLSYVEAVEYLADKAGLTVPRMNNSKQDEERERRQKRHYAMHKEAAGFYYVNLVRGNNPGAAYCESRGISPTVAKRFGIGYSPSGSDVLIKYLQSKGFTVDEMVAGGLARKNDNGKVRDFFFDRLMFPIMDIYGNVIAFGGRILGEGNPKYLNSSDSPLYNKKKHLYGLNIAKKNKQADRIILVEGYMDVVAVNSYGIGGAVASLGTALTKEQCLLIKRFTKDVYIAYDGDNAGRKAAIRASGLLMEEGILPKILVFRDGLDPDEFLKKYGADEFEKVMDKAVLPYRFEMDWLAESFDLSTEVGRRDFGAQAMKIVSTIHNELDKEDAIKYLSVKTGYSQDTLYKQGTLMNKDETVNNSDTNITVTPKKMGFRAKAEALAIKLALNGHREEILKELDEKDFEQKVFCECFKAVRNGLNDESGLMRLFEDEDKRKLAMKVIIIPESVVKKVSIKECVNAIKQDDVKARLAEYQRMLENPDMDTEERLKIFEKITELQKMLKQN